MLIKLLQFSQV